MITRHRLIDCLASPSYIGWVSEAGSRAVGFVQRVTANQPSALSFRMIQMFWGLPLQTWTQNSDLKVRPPTEKFIVDLLKTLYRITQVSQRGCSGRISLQDYDWQSALTSLTRSQSEVLLAMMNLDVPASAGTDEVLKFEKKARYLCRCLIVMTESSRRVEVSGLDVIFLW